MSLTWHVPIWLILALDSSRVYLFAYSFHVSSFPMRFECFPDCSFFLRPLLCILRILTLDDNLNDFSQLSDSELILMSLGTWTYQIKQARPYYGEYVRGNDGFNIEVCREVSNNLLRELSAANNSWLLRGRIHSRHISWKTYFIYILVEGSHRGREAIVMHYWNCIAGRRTVGCCTHYNVHYMVSKLS